MVVGAWRRSVSQLAGGFYPSAHPRRHSPRQGCERSDETPARAGLALEARGDVFVTHLKRFDMMSAYEGLAGDLATETWSPGTPS